MSYTAELRIYLISLKCIGLLCTNRECNISEIDDIQSMIGFIVAQIVSWFAIIYILQSPDRFGINQYSIVGNTYLVIDYCGACLTVSMVYLMFYVKRHRLRVLLELILQHNHNDLKDCYAKQFFTRFLINICMSSVCGIIFAQNPNYTISLLSRVLLWFIFTYSYVLLGLIIALYSCLTQILATVLQLYNRDLLSAIKETITLKTTTSTTWLKSLWRRNQMIIICRDQLNSAFGLVMVFITAFVILSAPAAPFYMITTVFGPDSNQLGQQLFLRLLIITIVWNIPWLVVMVMIFRKDEVSAEVCVLAFKYFMIPTQTYILIIEM